MYKFFLPAIIIVILSTSCSSPVIVKQKTVGGNDKDEPQSMCLTKDGGFVVAGNSFSQKSGEKLEDNRGFIYSDFWVIKFSNSAEIQWQKTIGGDNLDFARSITRTDDGGYIIGGESMSDSSGNKKENSRGSSDIWIVKLDSIGNVEWDKTIGGSGSDICTSIRQTHDRGYIIGGASNSNISGEKTENCHGDFDLWLIKLDNKGNIEWDKTLGGNKFEYCGGMELTDNDDIMICGTTGSDSFPEKQELHPGCWVAKLDMNGHILYEKFFGPLGMFIGVSKTYNNGFIFTAFSGSDKGYEKSENCKGGADIWVIRTDENGNKIWDKTIGGKDDDSPWCIKQTIDGGYIIGATSKSEISGDKTDTCRGNYDFWIIKLNKNGKTEWNKTIGGNDYDEVKDIAEISKNQFVIAGITFSDKSGDKTDYTRGAPDYWIVYLNK